MGGELFQTIVYNPVSVVKILNNFISMTSSYSRYKRLLRTQQILGFEKNT